MKKIGKGQYGYIGYQKKWTVIRTVIYFALCLSVFAIGYINTGTRKNLMTVIAILGCLPACKSLVNVVMFARARGCSEKLHDMITDVEEGMYGLYDLYMTSYKTSFPISHLTICEKTVIAITEDAKIDVNAAQDHITDHLKQDGHKDFCVKVYNDPAKYTERMKQLKSMELNPVPAQDSIMEMFLSISL